MEEEDEHEKFSLLEPEALEEVQIQAQDPVDILL
jgi:hypothetical protein